MSLLALAALPLHGQYTEAQQRRGFSVQPPKLIFFPPNPPPAGSLVQLPDPDEATSLAPEALRPYVNEPFYAPLGTFISPLAVGFQGGEGMSEEEQTMLKSFRRLRDELLAELRETVVRLELAEAGARRRELEALADRQTRPLENLENLAERLRASLARKADWSELRQWRLGAAAARDASRASQVLAHQVIRATAFYQDGLPAAQRRLLRELAMELEAQIFYRTDLARGFFFFMPETVRIPWPRALPAEIEGKLRRLAAGKDALKSELFEAVCREDASFFNASRARALRRLGESQEPRVAEIEYLAEEIRGDLAAAAVPGLLRAGPPRTLPVDLRERIERCEEMAGLLRSRTGENLADAIAHGSPLPSRDRSLARREWLQQWQARLQQRGRAPAADDAALMEALLGELDRLHGRLELETGETLDPVEGSAPDAFLRRYLDREDKQAAFHEYDIAVFEPGLSPAQRRLLFGAALEAMELPLPGAERQPTFAPGTIVR